MEQGTRQLRLEPLPESVSVARRWVRDVLVELGRDDVAEAAVAGTSELVTNVILHAKTDITVGVRAENGRLVVSVTDGTPLSSQLRLSSHLAHERDSTVGRGLSLVRAYAAEWGISVTDSGKSLWFVPSTGSAETAVPEFIPDLSGLVEPVTFGAEESVLVRLVDAPVPLTRVYQERWIELLRELQLIALGEASPIQRLAAEMCQVARQVRSADLMTDESLADYVDAIADGRQHQTLVLEVPRRLRPAVVRIQELFDEIDRVAVDHLLYVPSDEARALRVWWFSEAQRQLDGKPPRAWVDVPRSVEA